MKSTSSQLQQQRQFLLVLPLLVLPFLSLAFWALGGGKSTSADKPATGNSKGLNLQLPEPQLDGQTGLSKLSLYQEAQREAGKSRLTATPTLLQRLGFSDQPTDSAAAGSVGPDYRPDLLELQVTQRLSQLSALTQPSQPTAGARPAFTQPEAAMPPIRQDRFRQDVDRLETLMHAMEKGQDGQSADPQMRQLEGMLERILDIQHPERVRSRIQEHDTQPGMPSFQLQQAPSAVPVTLLAAGEPLSGNSTARDRTPPASSPAGFHGLTVAGVTESAENLGNTIPVVIHETQAVVSGGIVKMRLLADASIAGSLLPRGSLIYGTGRMSGERLLIDVKSVQIRQTVLPVALKAYDLDGLEGLYVPGSITREAARQGADRAISQPLHLPPISPSVGAQAAGAGLAAAQGLLSRRARQVKVSLKAGYHLLLRDQR